MPNTLITGANSFLAAHIIGELISAGHTITGSVRRPSAGDAILEEHPEWKDKLDFAIVEDYSEDGALDDVFKKQQFDHVIHTAAPMPGRPGLDDYDKDFLRPSVQGNLSLLKSAKSYARSLKSIAITGSINAITTGAPDDNAARKYTNDSWNDITQEYARESKSDFIMYCSSKKEAELAIWDFVKAEKPHFNVTVFLPALIFGPPLQPISDLKNLNYSVNVVYNFFNGSYEEVPNTHAGLFPSYIDARDLATAHVRALTTPAAANKRFLIGGAPLSSSLIVKTLEGLVEKDALPELKGRLPKDTGKDDDVTLARIGAEEGNEILEMKFRSAEETFGDLAKKVLELEKKEGK
ncbi:NAD(P)-binding protein [Lophiostoma macrostomum CBS 122681]|uniref:NAD(P)-binding protein n=1 Tax=Lophiostoma macrostomum CBS 122681 TaxID=1314788 RepID=A0A6A6SR75_9PLEO|nr:NAD(P)-binding protein [Lophiostoma macrostomum CBS 122681]